MNRTKSRLAAALCVALLGTLAAPPGFAQDAKTETRRNEANILRPSKVDATPDTVAAASARISTTSIFIWITWIRR